MYFNQQMSASHAIPWSKSINYKNHWDPGLFTCYNMLQHVTYYYFINFVEKGIPPCK